MPLFFFFFMFFQKRGDRIDQLRRLVTNREALNEHVRDLRAQGTSVELSSWPEDELRTACERGLESLSDERLAWLERNPIGLFALYDSINESLPDCWMELVTANARRMWDARRVAKGGSVYDSLKDDDEFETRVQRLSRVITSREALNQHVRKLRAQRTSVELDSWPEDELQTVLTGGLESLPDERVEWLNRNPIALFALHDAINESLPDHWMGLVLEDAKRLWAARNDSIGRLGPD